MFDDFKQCQGFTWVTEFVTLMYFDGRE